jgi:hypothetical protein
MRSPSLRPRPHQPQGQPARLPRAAGVSAMPSCPWVAWLHRGLEVGGTGLRPLLPHRLSPASAS